MSVTTPALHATPPGDSRRRLFEMICARSWRRGKEFTLSSGEVSGFFFDMKPTMLHPEGANLIADLVLELPEVSRADVIGGMAMGAIPIVSVVSARSFRTPNPIPAFFVRKEAKGHGTDRLIEGCIETGMNAVLIEDVTTKGNSVLKAVRAAREKGCVIQNVVSIVDREQGAREALADEGIKLIPIFTRSDFG